MSRAPLGPCWCCPILRARQALALSLPGLIGATLVVALRTSVLSRWIGRRGGITAGISVGWLIWDPALSGLLLAAALGFW